MLINFLAVDRAELLVTHPQYRFVITDHVRAEVTDFYPEQLERLERVLRSGELEEIRVDAIEELYTFATLRALPKRFGAGECAAIAVAHHRKMAIAIDDSRARKYVLANYRSVCVETTETLTVGLIRAGSLSIAEADSIKNEWEAKHRFRLQFGSFAGRV